MAVSLTHSKVSSIPDGADTSLVRPSDWNAEHVLSQGTGTLLGRTTAGTGATEEISPSSELTLSSLTLGIATTLGAKVISANTSGDALRITQTGAGNALVVEDSANPDSTPFVVNASGQVLVGSTSAPFASTEVGLFENTNDTSPAILDTFKNRAGAVVASGDGIGRQRFYGYDGANYVEAARIDALVDSTPGTNDMPGRLVFSTTADGASSPTERMRINNSGGVSIGTLTAGAATTFRLSKGVTGGTTSYAVLNNGTVQPDVTSTAFLFSTDSGTANNGGVPYTITNLKHFSASQGTFDADSTVTNQFGFIVESDLIGATNDYGFYSSIASGTGRWNFYANGTASNYFAGTTGIGTTSITSGYQVEISGKTRSTAYDSTSGIYENNATITADYTIASGNNAMSAGPITINSGITVTVPSGSTWTVV